MKLASKGNGRGEDVTPEQAKMCERLRDEARREAGKAWEARGFAEVLAEFCDEEAARRVLVARQWNYDNAKKQMMGLLAWRLEKTPWVKPFSASPACNPNPLGLCQRIIGFDVVGRPVIYLAFSQGHDRWNVQNNVEHMLLALEAAARLMKRRFHEGLTSDAAAQLTVWVLDFIGFGFWDQNPNSAVQTGYMMANYPEMLGLCVLLDAPGLFQATWKLVSAVIDDRVRQKVMFVGLSEMEKQLTPALGAEVTQWIVDESREIRQPTPKGSPTRKYWTPPSSAGAHDPRGLPSYVGSRDYVETPGDAYEKRRAEGKQATLAGP